jgi:hypothetical protein
MFVLLKITAIFSNVSGSVVTACIKFYRINATVHMTPFFLGLLQPGRQKCNHVLLVFFTKLRNPQTSFNFHRQGPEVGNDVI